MILPSILLAAGPAWTDIVQATAAVAGVIGVVGALGFSAWQLRLQRIDQGEALKVQMAQRALNLMQLLIDVERVLVEHPQLAPYFQSGEARLGKTGGKEPPPVDDPLRDQVLACALLFSDFAETVGWQIETHQMSREGRDSWWDYFDMLCSNNPAMKHVATRDAPILSAWAGWLLGVRKWPGTELEFRDLRKRRARSLVLDPRRSRARRLLEAVHRELFLPNFPDPDEQEGPSDWIPRLWGGAASPQPEQHAVVAGADLDDAAVRSLAGFAFVERYRDSQCALLSYIAVDRRWRGQHLARILFDQALASAKQAAVSDGGQLRAVFAEIHDPRRVERVDDAIDPATRLRIMAHLGARLVPIHYVQPALGEDGHRSDRLLLIAFPQNGERTVDASVVRDFLLEYYAALAVPNPAGDVDLLRIAEELGQGPVELAALDNLSAWRS